MFCRKCGKEMKPNEKFCPSCGAKVETEETVQAGSSVTDAAPNIVGTLPEKKKYPVKTVVIAIVVVVFAVILVSVLSSGNGKAKDEDYISAAETIISKQLTAPSTAIYSDENIEAQDDYGRTIVSLTVESQNSFGGYVTNTCYVLIESYDTEEDTFTYNAATGVYISDFGDSFSDTYISRLKESTDWNKPSDE